MSRVSFDQLFIPKDGLMECLKTVGAKPGPLTLQQVMDFMKEYIMKRQLFDRTFPARILCGQDPLGKVFGVEQFLVNHVIGLLVRQMYAVPRQHVVSQVQTVKRQQPQSAACSDDTTAEAAKRARLEAGSTGGATNQGSPMRLYIPSSPVYSSGAETEYSVQGRETDIVKDTSDDLWFLEESSDDYLTDSGATRREVLEAAAVAAEILRREAEGSDDSDCPFEVEYEIEEESDQGGAKASSLSSDSDVEELGMAEIVVCVNDDDAQFWADSSDSYSSDSEIGEPDLWQCRLCGERCEPQCLSAVQRYCTACWKQRFGWLPDRTERHPPQKKRRRVQRRNSAKRSTTKSVSALQLTSSMTTIEVRQLNSTGEEESRSVSDESAKSAPESSDVHTEGSQESTSGPSDQSEGLLQGSMSSSPDTATTAASSQEDPVSIKEEEQDWSRPGCSGSARSTLGLDSASSHVVEMCSICLVRPKCAILVHGRTSHRLSCYKCAARLHKNNLPCPVCRRRIQRVVRNFDA